MRAASGATSRFPRDARIVRKADFDRILRVPTRCGSALFRAQVARGEGPARARLGLAIAKKVARRAHDRNRLKRHAREVFRQVQGDLPAIDVVVFAKAEAVTASAAALRIDLQKLFERAAALNVTAVDGTMRAAASR